nr:MAG TPA: hypothetical protein [Caudoviricetes sp.]
MFRSCILQLLFFVPEVTFSIFSYYVQVSRKNAAS